MRLTASSACGWRGEAKGVRQSEKNKSVPFSLSPFPVQILRLTLLAPEVVEAILDARQARRLTLEFLLRRSISRDWEVQRRLVGDVALRTA